ncbi:unnamed protein product [Natator depressus]
MNNRQVFGQCKTITYINRPLKKEILHGYNCTVSPDHSQIAPRAEYFVEFTIKETRCSKSTLHANVSECEFLPGRHARVGFCRGKFASDTKNPDSLEISCEIYGPWNIITTTTFLGKDIPLQSPDIYEPTEHYVEASPLPTQDADCDDPDVFEAVDRALRKYNGDKTDGNQFALYMVMEDKRITHTLTILPCATPIISTILFSLGFLNPLGSTEYFKAKPSQPHGTRTAGAPTVGTGNSSVLYLTLDVLETQCSVLSRRHWEACKLPQHNETVFGQCKTITYINRPLKKEILHGYNCTVSPDHSQLYKCEHWPGRPTALEDIEQHRGDVERPLERYNEGSNHTQYFKIAPRAEYFVEFTIKETRCSKSTPHANVSECEFLPGRHAVSRAMEKELLQSVGTRVNSHNMSQCFLHAPHGLTGS